MSKIDSSVRPFVVAFNRDRDFYEVPVALEQSGLLDRLVTDYYAPQHGGIAALQHRQHPDLPKFKTHGVWRAVFLQAILPRLKTNIDLHWNVDRIIGATAAQVALRADADLFLYSRFAYESFSHPGLRNRRRGLFVFHPHPLLIHDILEKDQEAFPQVAWTYLEGKVSERQGKRENFEVREAEFCVAASSFTKRSLTYFGKPAQQVAVVPYGVKPLPYARQVHKPSGECRFLFVGQGIHRKGLHHLILAWQRLALPLASLTLICHSFDPALLPLAGQANITLLSKLPKPELEAQFEQAHVFCMPSLVEGFGLVYVEALSFGCFVIGTENTGLPDLNIPPAAAAIVPAGNLESLMKALEDAHRRHMAGEMDANSIIAFSHQLSWERFRQGIREEVVAAVQRLNHPEHILADPPQVLP